MVAEAKRTAQEAALAEAEGSEARSMEEAMRNVQEAALVAEGAVAADWAGSMAHAAARAVSQS